MGYCGYFAVQINNATLNNQQDQLIKLRVYPDELKVNGDRYSAIAYDLSHHQKVQMYGYIDSQAKQQQFTKIKDTTEWIVQGKRSGILPATNENQFDSIQFNLTKHIYNQVNIEKIESIQRAKIPTKLVWQNQCHRIRIFLIQYFAKIPATTRDYCNSLLIGNSPSDFYEKMSGVKQLGLIHLFSISGMHVVIFISLLRRLLIELHFNKEWTTWVLIVVLPAYLIIGGGSSSLIRSILMAELSLFGQAKLCHLSKVDIWSLGLLGGLLIQPNVLLTLGGQLSYLLALMLQFLPDQHESLMNAVLLNLVGLPSILYFVFEWHVLSLLASYLMIPFFSVVIFPLVIVAALSFGTLPQVTNLIEQCLNLFQFVVNQIGELPGLIHFGKPPLMLAMGLFVISLIVAALPNNRRCWLGLVASYLAIFCLIHFPLAGEVVFFDIGQGDSFLIRTPFNRNVILIDTGGQLTFPKPNWANGTSPTSRAMRVSVNYLKSKGISQIDTLCLSHQDTDHIGYSSDVLKHLKVKQIIYPAGMESQANFKQKVLPLAQHQHSKLVPVTDSSQIANFPLQILHPFKAGKGANEDSMVLSGKFGHKQFLFMGDLDQNGEKQVIKRYPNLKTDVLKLGHHGSKTASAPSFIKQVQPEVAIISAGRMNRYGHPNNKTMKTLKKQNVPSLSTQKYGMIKYEFDPFNHQKWITILKGNELTWMLPPYENS